jgi:PAS domain S-box-containing protein
MSFRLKTIVGIALIEAVLLTVIVGSSLVSLRRTGEHELITRAHTTARLFAAMTKDAVLSTDLASLESFAEELSGLPGVVYVNILGQSGVTLAGRGPKHLRTRLFRQDESLQGADDGVFDVQARIEEYGMTYGYVQLGLDTDRLLETMTSASRRIMVLAGLEMVLVALFSLVLGLFLTRQLGHLEQASQAIARGRFGFQVPVKGSDELARTAQAFNRMSLEIKRIWDEREEALRESRAASEELRAILQGTVDGYISVDQTGRITSFNRAAESIFGYKAAEVVGDDVTGLMPRRFRAAHDKYFRSAASSGRLSAHTGRGAREVVGLRKDGVEVPLELSLSVISHKDRIIFSGLIQDITRKKKVAAMKKEFISTVSHELRTPLTSIQGALGLLRGSADMDAQKASGLIDIAWNNSQRLIRLIADILDMEKLETGRMTFNKQDVDLVRISAAALEGMSGYAARHQVSFDLEAPGTPVLVTADPDRLGQVLDNLLSNAAKFSPPGGRIEVRVTGGTETAGVRVTDQGPGIPDGFADHVFEKFSQVDSSDTRAKGGSGLGLSIAKAIVASHGGRIWFEAAPGGGTAFSFEIPAA